MNTQLTNDLIALDNNPVLLNVYFQFPNETMTDFGLKSSKINTLDIKQLRQQFEDMTQAIKIISHAN